MDVRKASMNESLYSFCFGIELNAEGDETKREKNKKTVGGHDELYIWGNVQSGA